MMTGITVVEVVRGLGVEPQKKITWAIGRIAQAAYREKFGEEVPKMNRPKTKGSGSHCHAVYPSRWRKKLVEMARKVCELQGIVVPEAQG